MTDEAHEAKRRKAEARDLVTSWVLALWALGAGCYLTGGGAKHLNSPAYTYVLSWISSDYHVIGVLLLLASVVNIIGVGTGNTLTLAIGTTLVGLWLAAISIGMFFAATTVPDGGNLNWITSLCLSFCYFIRAYNKIKPPRMAPVLGFLTLAMLPFL